MRALRFSEFGGLDRLQLVEMPEPLAGSGEVVVEIRAAALNPSDAKNVQGRMEGTTLPRTPGRDFAGVVVAGPPEWLGREVWGTGGEIGYTQDGSHAERIVLPAAGVRAKPARLSFEEAASVGVAFLAAWLGLVEAAALTGAGPAPVRLGRTVPSPQPLIPVAPTQGPRSPQVGAATEPGEIVLITGADGGVGSAAGQIARWHGARTVGAARSPLPDAGSMDDFILLSGADPGARLVESVMQLTAGRGVNVCFDTVGGPLFEPCLRSLAHQGRQVSIASVGDRRVCFDLLDFYHRRLSLFGVDTRAYDAIASAQRLEALARGFEIGALRPPAVGRRFRLDEFRDAYQGVSDGSLRGKAVFVTGWD